MYVIFCIFTFYAFLFIYLLYAFIYIIYIYVHTGCFSNSPGDAPFGLYISKPGLYRRCWWAVSGDSWQSCRAGEREISWHRKKVILKILTPKSTFFLAFCTSASHTQALVPFFIFPMSPAADPAPWDCVFVKPHQSRARRRQRVDMKV